MDNNNKENNNNNKENLMSLLSSLFVFVVVFLVGYFIINLYIDFRNQNKDEWINVYNLAGDINIYYNPSKIIHTQNGNVRMLIKITGESVRYNAIKIGVEDNISAERYNNWAHEEELLEFDCKNQNIKYLYRLSRDADGKSIHSKDLDDSFSPVILNSLEEKLYKIACENQSFLCKLPFFCK